LGTLAAGLAHELRNPLVSIRTFSALIEEQGSDAEFRREFRGVVERDVKRIGSIIDHVAAFAENSQVKFAPVQIDDVISGVHDIARPEFTRANVTLAVKPAFMPAVRANYGQLIQVFLNLFQNAIQAMEGRENSRIEVAFESGLPVGGKRTVRVTVSDNGPGIDLSVRERIFDPFVTTKATGEPGARRGMGLGLSIVKRIVDGHGGMIDVVSEPGRGTSFFVSLPCAELSS
jgi:two-component system nitrogen regulation sensor histidine kinase GlnL